MADPNSDNELLNELKLWRKERAAAPVGKAGELPIPPGFDAFDKGLIGSANKLGPLGKTAALTSAGFSKLQAILETSVTTFRSISNVGASFSNDIVGMTIAATGARVSIKEFGDVIRDNSKLVSSLGGNITRSVEEFSKLSKEMFDEHSRTTNQLETLGYTTKDLNEVLALSTFARRTTDLQDKTSRAEAIRAATNLAYEMDAMAKLTGKSREEQQEAMKRHMVQGQVEAKFLMIRAKEGDAAEKVARSKYQEALTTAVALGKQQEFMEGFLTGGGAITQAAGNMLSVSESSRQLARLGGDIGKAGRDSVDAAAASRRAMSAATKDMQNPSFLSMGVYGQALGDAGQQVIKSVEDQAVLNRAILKIQEDEFKASGKRLSTEEATAKALEDVRQAQMGFSKQADGTYKKVDGANQAMVQMNSAARTVASSLTHGMKPAIDKVQESLGKFGNRLLTQDVKSVSPKGEVSSESLAKAVEKPLKEGVQRGLGELPAKVEKKDKYGATIPTVSGTPFAKELEALGQGTGSTVKGISDVFNKVLPTNKPIDVNIKNAGSRAGGTPGKTGKMFEPTDFFGMIHQGETVLTPDQMQKFTSGVQQSGMVEAVQKLSKTMQPDTSGNIDLNKMMSGVTATISSTQKAAPNVENLLGDFMSGPMFGQKQNAQYTSEVSEETKAKRKALNDEYRIEQSKLAKEIYSTIPASYSAEQRSRAIQENSQMLALKEKHRQQTLKLLEDEGKNKKSYGENERKVLEQSNEWKKNILKEGQLAQTSLLKNTQAEQKQLLATGNQKSVTETVTGGGSTLRKVVDTPNKIKLEKEQDALLEQYRLNRKAIADKIKQETGLKGKTLFEAMEASPEALALKSNFEKQNDDYSRKILNERQAVTEILEEDAKLSKEKVKTVKKDIESNLTSSKKQTAAQEEKTKASLEDIQLAVQEAKTQRERAADHESYHMQVEYLATVKLNEAKKEFEKDKSEKNKEKVEETQRKLDFAKKNTALAKVKYEENQKKLDLARKSFLDAKNKLTAIDKQTSAPKTADEIKNNAPIAPTKTADEIKNNAPIAPTKTADAIKDIAPKSSFMGADGKINLDAIKFGPTGLPIISDIKAKAAEIPASEKAKDDAKKQEEEKKKAEATAKPKEQTDSTVSKSAPGTKQATLDDVVTSLNSLNTKMTQLIAQSQDNSRRQVNATKANSQNLYAR